MASAANVPRWVDLHWGVGWGSERGVCVCVFECVFEREGRAGGLGEGPQSARSAQVELH